MSIVVKDNVMADIPSRAFKDGKFTKAQKSLTPYFNSNFPLPHNNSCKEYRIPVEVILRVISFLHGYQLLAESLRKLPGLGRIIVVTGSITAKNV